MPRQARQSRSRARARAAIKDDEDDEDEYTGGVDEVLEDDDGAWQYFIIRNPLAHSYP